MTDQAVITSTGELLAALSRLDDDELLLLDRSVWRLANESGREAGRPRIAEVIRRCGVVLAEEQDRRRVLAESPREQSRDGDRSVCPLGDPDDRFDLDGPSTD